MRKLSSVVILIIALIAVSATPSLAWHHGRSHVFIGVGVGPWWGPPYWYPYYYPYYYPPYYGYAPPPVVVQEPPVYVQQPAVAAPAAPAPSAQSVETFWYYCPSAKGYYPSVSTCPEAWV